MKKFGIRLEMSNDTTIKKARDHASTIAKKHTQHNYGLLIAHKSQITGIEIYIDWIKISFTCNIWAYDLREKFALTSLWTFMFLPHNDRTLRIIKGVK